MKRILFTISLSLLLFSSVWSQSKDIYEKYNIYRNPIRVALNKISFTLSVGYGLTEYKHNLSGYHFYQDSAVQLISRSDTEIGTNYVGYSNWFNDPVAGDTVALTTSNFPSDADSLGLKFQNTAHSIPISLSIHYDFNKIRIGGGFTFEQQFLNEFKPSVFQDSIRSFEPTASKAGLTRLWGMAGYQFHDWWNYTFVGELRAGIVNYGKSINSGIISSGNYFNLGVNIERNFSEYFRVVIRPSYDIKSFNLQLPDGSTLRHTGNAFLIEFGISINIPEIPRSPYQSDHVQLKHVITDKNGNLHEVRGQPIWKVQNPKVGQNHRRLWRYKLKNRRKLDPY